MTENARDEVVALIHTSIEDDVLSRSEKKELKQYLNKLNPDETLSDWLRSEIFRLARLKLNENNALFILDWLEAMNKVLLSVKKIESQQEKVFFSPGETCLSAILEHILATTKKIRICLFTISDNRISEALISKHNQGIDVRIISDNDKRFDKGSDIDALAAAGIPIRLDETDNHMHHKFALFDDSITLTGSYNWTRSAEKYNHENILITDSKSVLSAFERQFDKLWHSFPNLK
jgi:cardiolipin hydrolase